MAAEDLLYILLFIGIILAQYLMQRAQKARERDAEPLPEIGDGREAAPIDADDWGAAGEAVVVRTGAVAPEPARRRARTAMRDDDRGPHSPRPPRRYSRHGLFGDKDRAQRAVVAATILGPCRADRPYDSPR